MLVADETAMPAMYSIMESLAPGDPGVTAILELPDESYDTGSTSPLRPQIVLRGTDAPGSSALKVLQATRTDDLDYAWVCGESALATGARRLFVKEWRVARRSIMFSGYWKLGQARN